MQGIDLYFVATRGSAMCYLWVAALGLFLLPKLQTKQRLVVVAIGTSVLFIGVQLLTTGDNHWVNTVWPRLQGGLLLAAMTTGLKRRVVYTVAPAACVTWLTIAYNGLTPFTEKMVEVTVFATIAFMASRQRNAIFRWALLAYALPTVILGPALAHLASHGLWATWIPLFEIVHLGRITGLSLLAIWLWRSTYPAQLELFPSRTLNR